MRAPPLSRARRLQTLVLLLVAAALLPVNTSCVGASVGETRASGSAADAGFADADCGLEGEPDATLTHATPAPEVESGTPAAQPAGTVEPDITAPACGCGSTIHCGPTAGCNTRVVVCGACAAPETCGGGGHHYACGTGETCTPLTCEQLGKSSCSACAAGKSCQVAGDGCGHAMLCGPCQ
jgi:hypothetical protein